jgi:hypothetical protein
MTTLVPSRAAIWRACSGVPATSPRGIGTPYWAKTRFDWYSCSFKFASSGQGLKDDKEPGTRSFPAVSGRVELLAPEL